VSAVFLDYLSNKVGGMMPLPENVGNTTHLESINSK